MQTSHRAAIGAEVSSERLFLTPAKDFQDVSRGSPVPHSLKGEALVKAGLTQETWRLEIVADGKAVVTRQRTLSAGTVLDLNALLDLGKTRGVRL